MDGLVLLKTYHNKYDAEAAVGLLKTNGIEAILSSDISLGDNQVLVKKEDLEKAREATKPLEGSLSEEDLREIEEIAVQEKERPFRGEKTKKITIAILLVIAAFVFSYVLRGYKFYRFPGIHKQKYYAAGLDCKQPNPDSQYAVCREYYKNKEVRAILIYKENKLDGSLKEFFENGRLRREWASVRGKLDGPFREYYANGQVRVEGAFKNDKMEGEYREYYETGELKRIFSFKDDLLDGHYKTFYKSSTVMEDVELVNGVRFDETGKPYQGVEKTFHENGALWEVFNYKDGKLEGLNKSYHENGNLESEGNYRNGRLHGEAKYYYPNGTRQFVSQYWSDVPTTVKEYDEAGNLIFESSYK